MKKRKYEYKPIQGLYDVGNVDVQYCDLAVQVLTANSRGVK